MTHDLRHWNLRKLDGDCSEGSLHVVCNCKRVVEGIVDQLDGEVGRIRGGGRPRECRCASSRRLRKGIDGQGRDKGKREREGERARQPN